MTSSIGSSGTISFWQQDQNYWTQVQQEDQTQSESSTTISNLFGASSTLSSGLSSLANQTALTRTNNALTAAIQSALQQESGSSTTSSPTSSTTASNSTSTSVTTPPLVTPPSPATGTGTTLLTGGTQIYGLNYTISGTFTVGDGNNTTTYTVAQGDTVGDLINAINSNAAGNANAFAYLNGSGNLVVTATNTTQSITVGGDYAAALGFGSANNYFAPTGGSTGAIGTSSGSSSASSSSTSSSSSAGSTSTTTSGSTGSSTSSSTTTSSGIPANSAYALQTGSTAETLLASNGLSGSLVDLLA